MHGKIYNIDKKVLNIKTLNKNISWHLPDLSNCILNSLLVLAQLLYCCLAIEVHSCYFSGTFLLPLWCFISLQFRRWNVQFNCFESSVQRGENYIMPVGMFLKVCFGLCWCLSAYERWFWCNPLDYISEKVKSTPVWQQWDETIDWCINKGHMCDGMCVRKGWLVVRV